jgi:hypothetical protein
VISTRRSTTPSPRGSVVGADDVWFNWAAMVLAVASGFALGWLARGDRRDR